MYSPPSQAAMVKKPRLFHKEPINMSFPPLVEKMTLRLPDFRSVGLPSGVVSLVEGQLPFEETHYKVINDWIPGC